MGEALFEVVVEQARFIGKNRQGNIVAHAVGGFFGLLRHGDDNHVHVFSGVAESRLLLQQAVGIGGIRWSAAAVGFSQGRTGGNPFSVGMLSGNFALDVPVFQDLVVFQVDGEHLTGAEATFFEDIARFEIDHPRFGGDDDEAIAGDNVAGGAQSVAIETGTDGFTIAECEQGRSVPGFLNAAVVFVEVHHFRIAIEFRLVLIGFGNQQHQGFEGRASRSHQ